MRRFYHLGVTHFIIITLCCTDQGQLTQRSLNRTPCSPALLTQHKIWKTWLRHHTQYSSVYIWKCCCHVIITTFPVVCVNINTCCTNRQQPREPLDRLGGFRIQNLWGLKYDLFQYLSLRLLLLWSFQLKSQLHRPISNTLIIIRWKTWLKLFWRWCETCYD